MLMPFVENKEDGLMVMHCKKLLFIVFNFFVFVPIVFAQNTDNSENQIFSFDPLVITGSRTITDDSASPVPVDRIEKDELLKTGHNELGRAIQTLIPSFNFSSSTISDGTDSVRPATLRGMGPDQVLLLINGKRRHGSALIHVNTSVGRGTAGYDINSIPISAIDRVEVLRDGASALYGSDAIAGVINIILKTDYEGAVYTSYGETYEGDGAQFITRLNKGFSIGGDGVLHLAAEFRDRQRTNRAGLSGTIQYPDSTSFPLDDNDDNNFDPVLNTNLINEGFRPGTIVLLNDPDGKEASFNRRNFRIGDADAEYVSGVYNFEKPISIGSGANIYSFGSISRKESTSGGFYRRANDARNPGASYPDGFLPLIETTVWDFSLNMGVDYEFDSGLKVDLGVTHGGNTFNFGVKNSHNASWVYRKLNPDTDFTFGTAAFRTGTDPFSETDFSGSIPTSADSGELALYLTTVNLDFVMPIQDWLKLAWGGEYKRDNYKIEAGDPYSYEDYDGITESGAPGGIQVFPGFQPENEVDESRHAFALYTEASVTPYESLLISPAVRYERYSDFGNSLNGKIAAKLDAFEIITFRGSLSSGFRAPSMQQLYFNNVSTQFLPVGNDQVPFEVGTFRNDSEIANAIGIPDLDEETSVNWSGGFLFKPFSNFSITTDFYYITVDNRIILSGPLEPGNEALSQTAREFFIARGIGRAQFFMNAADTRTKGVDIISAWQVPFVSKGSLKLKFAGTISDTKITSVNLPVGLPDSLYTDRDRSILEEWQPDSKFTLSGNYDINRFSFWLAFHRYGEYRITNGGRQQTYGAKYLTDAQMSIDLGRLGAIKFGANNLFDVTPDRNEITISNRGTIIDPEGNVIVDSPGVFTYSRGSAPFGFNGGFYYVAFERSL